MGGGVSDAAGGVSDATGDVSGGSESVSSTGGSRAAGGGLRDWASASGGAPIRGMTTASSFRYANADAANVSGHSLHAHRVHTTHAAESFLPMNNATAGAQQAAAAAAAAAAVATHHL